MTKQPLSVQYRSLIMKARTAMEHSHSPYSNFRVGAALLTKGGRIYSGCNIENSSYSLTICAERTSFFKAVSEGERAFRAIAIVSDAVDFIPPCGACRQVMMDLAGDIDVILQNGKMTQKVIRLNALLPLPFNPILLKTRK